MSLDSLNAAADAIIGKYPVSNRSASLPLLHLVQEKFGFISDEAVEWVAAKLGLQPINIFELVTFYPMFHRKPIGKNHIKVCRTLSCALNGGEGLCEHFQKKLGVGLDETTKDGKFTVSHVECIAACGTAPVIMINDDFYENVSKEQADRLIQKYGAS
jgi:NADH-quinone oxidoreductase subunit E